MKILVTGGYGLIGSAIHHYKSNIIRFHKSEYNLIKSEDTEAMFDKVKPDIVIHLAAKVGGLGANKKHKAQFYTENMLINTNVLAAAHKFDVKKLLSVMSACVYPDEVAYPITEDQLHNGLPHESNLGYAMTKRCLDIQSRCYRDEYGCNFITIIPCNVFGEYDNFNLEDSHVLPAIIRKIYEAKDSITMWGSGKPLREFIYSKDLSQIILYLIDNYHSPDPINIGLGNEISIRDLTYKVASVMGYDGKIIWDETKADGQYRKPIDCTKLKNIYQIDPIGFEQGLINTCNWFKENYPNVRL